MLLLFYIIKLKIYIIGGAKVGTTIPHPPQPPPFFSSPSFSCSSNLALLLVLNKVSWRIIRSAKMQQSHKSYGISVRTDSSCPSNLPPLTLKGLLWPRLHKPLSVYDAVWLLDLCSYWKCYVQTIIIHFIKTKSQRSHSEKCLMQQIFWHPLKAAMRSHNKTLILHLHISHSYQSLSVAWSWWEWKKDLNEKEECGKCGNEEQRGRHKGPPCVGRTDPIQDTQKSHCRERWTRAGHQSWATDTQPERERVGWVKRWVRLHA